jgi:hypothetical protein
MLVDHFDDVHVSLVRIRYLLAVFLTAAQSKQQTEYDQ